jgi:predicted DsbA family dithiol-disulfide isomerase
MQLDVYHDTVCPWCRIGKRHLQLALAEWRGEAVDVRYRTFFLNPDIPTEGYPFRAYMNAKGGGRVPLEQWFAAPREAGARVGLTFNFDRIEHAPNSTLSHQMIALVPLAMREAVIDAVYTAYFEHGRNIGDLEVLLSIAQDHQLDTTSLRQDLANNARYDDIMAEVNESRQLGVTGVPFFVVDNRLAFSGAQPPAVILQVLQKAIEMREA